MGDYIGKIYKLVDDTNVAVYIGSTKSPLSKRLSEHKANIKRGRTTTHIKLRDYTGLRIELIEEFACDSRKQLCHREGEIASLYKDLLNKQSAGRTNSQYMKEWRNNNTEYMKAWCEQNKSYMKTYYRNNKDRLREIRQARKNKV